MFRYAVRYMIARNYDLKDAIKVLVKNVDAMSKSQLERLHLDIGKAYNNVRIEMKTQESKEIIDKMYSESWAIVHMLDIIEKEQSLRGLISDL